MKDTALWILLLNCSSKVAKLFFSSGVLFTPRPELKLLVNLYIMRGEYRLPIEAEFPEYFSESSFDFAFLQ
ncbi:hypothetical protein EDB82DRAFT_506745 [Fusarium venenatum]|uniref:uncharacterized protein n=1 Tax=Fusarium venenatum TaxID=56646 RepID=UPI001E0A7CBD|nr:hypothetical protein EDB82DRAFT_506745 [Fusarium venenatum]